MFGYIYVNEQELKLKDYTAYRSFTADYAVICIKGMDVLPR